MLYMNSLLDSVLVGLKNLKAEVDYSKKYSD